MNLQEITKSYDFSGRTAVVTGGAGILGREMAAALVGCGANVAILDLRPADPALLDRLQAGSGQVMVLQANVLDRTDLLAAAEATAAKFGPVEMLLNVAGGHQPQAITTPTLSFFDLSVEGLRQVIDLNLMGTILPTQIFAQGMVDRGEGAGLILCYRRGGAGRWRIYRLQRGLGGW